MANEKNLIPQAHTLTVEEASKGGQNSGKARREKKTIQKILIDYLDNDVQDIKSLHKVAAKAGVSTDQSVKELATAVCLLNTLKKGDVDKLHSLMALLGEDNAKEHNNGILDELTEYLKNE